MRDGLIDLIDGFRELDAPQDGRSWTEHLADHLLANGVIVPPVNVGQTVWCINRKPLGGHWEDNRYIVDGWGEYKVCEIPFSLTLWECGWDGIFLTKEEAERVLAERNGSHE